MKWFALIILTISVFSLGIYTGLSRTNMAQDPAVKYIEATTKNTAECSPASYPEGSSKETMNNDIIPSPDELWAKQNGKSLEDVLVENEQVAPSTFSEEPISDLSVNEEPSDSTISEQSLRNMEEDLLVDLTLNGEPLPSDGLYENTGEPIILEMMSPEVEYPELFSVDNELDTAAPSDLIQPVEGELDVQIVN